MSSSPSDMYFAGVRGSVVSSGTRDVPVLRSNLAQWQVQIKTSPSS